VFQRRVPRASGSRAAGRATATDAPPGTEGKPAPGKPPASAKVLAIRMLARREYSRAELSRRLARKGVSRELIETVLDELAAAGYLSDARYAQAMVTQKSGRYGKRAIAYALREKGIAAPDALVAMAPLAAVDEFTDAQALWQRRFGTPPANEREKARQVRFLLARGYGVSIALRVLRDAGTPADE
jgi:regulatory protein